MKQKIALFVPPNVKRKNLDMDEVRDIFGKDMYYASKGRYAILHIVKSYALKNRTILISAYMCETVRDTLIKSGYSIEYYDIDPEDLNPCAESIKRRLKETNASVVVVPSLYGNPADLKAISEICKNSDAIMIDDAAQSFGAIIDGKRVGTYGDGGLIAFSPGKATSAHMGALYWTNGTNSLTRTHHAFIHWCIWEEYRINRQNAYSNNYITVIIGKILVYLIGFLLKHHDISNDGIEEFEKSIVGGVLEAAYKDFSFRERWYFSFLEDFGANKNFRIIKAKHGVSKPHKIVLVFFNKTQADVFRQLLRERLISYFDGYDVSSFSFLEGCNEVKDCIVELPIEDNELHMSYIHKVIREYLGYNNSL